MGTQKKLSWPSFRNSLLKKSVFRRLWFPDCFQAKSDTIKRQFYAKGVFDKNLVIKWQQDRKTCVDLKKLLDYFSLHFYLAETATASRTFFRKHWKKIRENTVSNEPKKRTGHSTSTYISHFGLYWKLFKRPPNARSFSMANVLGYIAHTPKNFPLFGREKTLEKYLFGST